MNKNVKIGICLLLLVCGLIFMGAINKREGLESETYQKMKTAWCSNDPQVSLTTLKLGKTIKSDDCTKKIVSKHYNLAKEFNARGTPTIILENGFLLAGYHSAEEILNFLKK